MFEAAKENQRLEGYATASKFVVTIVRNYRQSKAQLQEEPKQPKTPQEEYDLIAEKMGQLEDRLHRKFEAIRSVIPKDARPPQNETEMNIILEKMWQEICHCTCFIDGEAISKANFEEYRKLGHLYLRKKELEKQLTASGAK